SGHMEGAALLLAGRMDELLQVVEGLMDEPGLAHVMGLVGRLLALPVLGRIDEAQAVADETVTAARAHGNPFWIAGALDASGRAFTDADPARALDDMHQALDVARDHRAVIWEAIVTREAAGLEAVHGDPGRAVALFQSAVDSLHRAGDVAIMAL